MDITDEQLRAMGFEILSDDELNRRIDSGCLDEIQYQGWLEDRVRETNVA